MSKIINFPGSGGRSPAREQSTQDTLDQLLASYAAVGAALLNQAVDSLENALNKAQNLVNAMPKGKGRDESREKLAALRRQLKSARSLSAAIVEPGPGADG